MTPNDGHNRPYRQQGLETGNRIVAVGSGLMRRLGAMTKAETVAKLEALVTDPEQRQGDAEKIVCSYLRSHKACDIAEAFERAMNRAYSF